MTGDVEAIPTEAAGPPVADAAPTFGYQPALDGLRALAVLSVMAFHASLWNKRFQWTGGWLGVDIFFVLSGFLITRLLLIEFARQRRIDLRSFYVRRVLRLYPLIALVLVWILVERVLNLESAALRPSSAGVAGIAFYYSNWVVVHAQSNRPLGTWSHLWTLSIEEQFYIVWPLVLLGLLVAGLRRRGVAIVSACLAAAVVAYRNRIVDQAWHYGATNPFTFGMRIKAGARWYYGSFTHTDGLLIGACLAAILAFDLSRVPRLVATALRWLAPVTIVVIVVMMDRAQSNIGPIWLPTWGLAVFNLATAVLVAHLMVSPAALLTRTLALRPLVWIGRRSYGIYVFNLPIYNYAEQHVHRHPEVVLAIGTLATFAVAGASYRWFERPFLRLKSRFAPAATG